MKKIIFLLLLSAISYQLSANTALASIEVEPLRIELEIDSAKTSSGYISLTNHGEEAAEITLSPGEYRYMLSENTIYPKNITKKLPSCKAWIQIKPDKVKLEKNATQQVQYTINAPVASSGEYVAAILIDEEQQTAMLTQGKAGQVRIKITPRISIPVYVTTKNILRRGCEISEFSAVQSSDKKEVAISLTLKNTGTTHIRPGTTLVIFDEAGSVAAKFALGKSLPIFGGFGERLSKIWKPRFPGKYTLVATVDIGAQPLTQKKITFEAKQ